jgi:hypothetical protein
MSRSEVSLRARVVPDRLPLDAICDVALRLVLRNEGSKTIEIYPQAAKLDAISTFAGIGMSWGIALLPENGTEPLPLQELRRYYGPPGNPPSPAHAKTLGVSLAQGEEHVVDQFACWIPNARLLPEHLSPAVLDPEGMEGIGPRSWTPSPGDKVPPPLRDSFPLAKASVLVFGAPAAAMEAAMREQHDFLRGRVVAFVPAAGTYELHVGYSQSSWMGLGETFNVKAAPVRLRVGE